jgi:hypothetical protein
MNWDAIGSVAEVFGAVGVIISLLYLAGQVRQSNREMRSSTSQNFLSSFNALTEFSTSSEYGAKLFHRWSTGKMEDANASERYAYRFFMLKMHRLYEHAYLQHKAGLLADDVWSGLRIQIAMIMAMPGVRQSWKPQKRLLNAEYVSFVESLVDESTRIATDYSDAWGSIKPEWAPVVADHRGSTDE